MIRNAALVLAGATLVPTLLAAAPVRASDVVAGMPAGPAFELVVTAVPGDDLGPCGTENHVVVAPDEDVFFCSIITNTGSEALTAHVRTDSTLPGTTGTNEVVEPGASMMMTSVQSSPVSVFHEVTWVATGVDSGTEVGRVAYAYVTIDGTQSQLDMTVMVDDGQETCGTESEIAVPAGTPVRVCYTMTNPFDFALVHHVLIDEHVGAFLIGFGADLGPGESFVRTDVSVIDETTTWVGYWRAQNEPEDDEDKVLYQDVDSVTIEVLEQDLPTTTTTTTTAPCVATPAPEVPTTPQTTTAVDHHDAAADHHLHDEHLDHDHDNDNDVADVDHEPGAGRGDDVHDVGRAGRLCRCRSRRAASGVDASGGGAVPGDTAWRRAATRRQPSGDRCGSAGAHAPGRVGRGGGIGSPADVPCTEHGVARHSMTVYQPSAAHLLRS